jgi:hypothetical protein
MAICPLSILSGKQTQCEKNCAYCPPRDFELFANNTNYFDYLQCLNYPNDMFGNGMAENGLSQIASAIGDVSMAITDMKS